jgi:hypothetical protein
MYLTTTIHWHVIQNPLDAEDIHPAFSANINVYEQQQNKLLKVIQGYLRRIMYRNFNRQVNDCVREYILSFHKAESGRHLPLYDKGAKGDVSGNNVRNAY